MTSLAEATNSKDIIDEHLFVEALALTAFEISYREPSPADVEKIILLLERMNHSEGPAKVQKAYGKTRFGHGESNDLLHILRQNYPQFFEVHKDSIYDN